MTDFKYDFDAEVEKIARRMCEILSINPEPVNYCYGPDAGWTRFEKTVADWLEMEAFSVVRNELWREGGIQSLSGKNPPKQELLLEGN